MYYKPILPQFPMRGYILSLFIIFLERGGYTICLKEFVDEIQSYYINRIHFHPLVQFYLYPQVQVLQSQYSLGLYYNLGYQLVVNVLLLSSKCIYPICRTQFVLDLEVVLRQDFSLACLMYSKHLYSYEIFQGLIVRDNLDYFQGSFEVYTLVLKTRDYCKQFLIVDQVVQFYIDYSLRVVSYQVPFAIGLLLGQDTNYYSI